jgi:hypothetical protein
MEVVYVSKNHAKEREREKETQLLWWFQQILEYMLFLLGMKIIKQNRSITLCVHEHNIN